MGDGADRAVEGEVLARRHEHAADLEPLRRVEGEEVRTRTDLTGLYRLAEETGADAVGATVCAEAGRGERTMPAPAMAATAMPRNERREVDVRAVVMDDGSPVSATAYRVS